MENIDLSALAQATDTSFGRSSTPNAASFSVKWKILGESRIQAMYMALSNFGTEREMLEMKRACEKDSIEVIAEYVKHVKKMYKDLTGDTLSLKQIGSDVSLEMIGMNPHNPKRTCYFKNAVLFEMA
jgi:hypothetical protein